MYLIGSPDEAGVGGGWGVGSGEAHFFNNTMEKFRKAPFTYSLRIGSYSIE